MNEALNLILALAAGFLLGAVFSADSGGRFREDFHLNDLRSGSWEVCYYGQVLL